MKKIISVLLLCIGFMQLQAQDVLKLKATLKYNPTQRIDADTTIASSRFVGFVVPRSLKVISGNAGKEGQATLTFQVNSRKTVRVVYKSDASRDSDRDRDRSARVSGVGLTYTYSETEGGNQRPGTIVNSKSVLMSVRSGQASAGPTVIEGELPQILSIYVPSVCTSSDPNSDCCNLITNSGFERMSNVACAALIGADDLKNFGCAWGSPSVGTPDYFRSSCGVVTGIPTNQRGVQAVNPLTTGNAYAGIIVYDPNSLFGLAGREFVTQPLTSLVTGRRYYTEVYVSVADNYQINPTALSITLGSVASPVTSPLLRQVATASTSNRAGWDRIGNTFVAQATDKNIVFGNFTASNIRAANTLSTSTALPATIDGSYV